MTYFSDLNDDQIVEGLRRHDETITRDYFYGFCRIAYFHLNKYYHLIGQEGLDFYSLAHEYYLSLVMKDWLPLTHRKKETKLSTWMVNGFRYIVLDKIKALQSKMMYESLEERLMQRMSDNNIEIEENPMNYGSTLDELCTELDIRAIDRQILIALLQDGYKSKEVAGWLGITPSAVSQRYHRMLNEKIIPYFKVGYPHIARKYMEEARPVYAPYHARAPSNIMKRPQGWLYPWRVLRKGWKGILSAASLSHKHRDGTFLFSKATCWAYPQAVRRKKPYGIMAQNEDNPMVCVATAMLYRQCKAT